MRMNNNHAMGYLNIFNEELEKQFKMVDCFALLKKQEKAEILLEKELQKMLKGLQKEAKTLRTLRAKNEAKARKVNELSKRNSDLQEQISKLQEEIGDKYVFEDLLKDIKLRKEPEVATTPKTEPNKSEKHKSHETPKKEQCSSSSVYESEPETFKKTEEMEQRRRKLRKHKKIHSQISSSSDEEYFEPATSTVPAVLHPELKNKVLSPEDENCEIPGMSNKMDVNTNDLIKHVEGTIAQKGASNERSPSPRTRERRTHKIMNCELSSSSDEEDVAPRTFIVSAVVHPEPQSSRSDEGEFEPKTKNATFPISPSPSTEELPKTQNVPFPVSPSPSTEELTTINDVSSPKASGSWFFW